MTLNVVKDGNQVAMTVKMCLAQNPAKGVPSTSGISTEGIKHEKVFLILTYVRCEIYLWPAVFQKQASE